MFRIFSNFRLLPPHVSRPAIHLSADGSGSGGRAAQRTDYDRQKKAEYDRQKDLKEKGLDSLDQWRRSQEGNYAPNRSNRPDTSGGGTYGNGPGRWPL